MSIKVINQNEGDLALNIGRIFQYKCDCGSFGTISVFSNLDNDGNSIEDIECPNCNKKLTN